MTYVKSHYTMLVYPFFHSVTSEKWSDRLSFIQTRWRLWWNRLGEDPNSTDGDGQAASQRKRVALEKALDDTYFFLPYVRELLFPETALLTARDVKEQVNTLEDLGRKSLRDWHQLHPFGMLRLSYNSDQLRSLIPLTLNFNRKKPAEGEEAFSAPVRLCWIDVALLPQHIGFLFLKVQLDEERPTVTRLTDLLYYLRQVHKPTLDWQLAKWKHSTSEEEYEFDSRDLVDFLLSGFTEAEADLSATPISFSAWLKTADSVERYSSTERGQIYGESFRIYTYACLDDPPPADAAAPKKNQPTATNGNKQLFESDVQQTLYELATGMNITDQNHDYMPHNIGLRQTMRRGRIALWQNWEGMALHDNVVFLGARPTPFTCYGLAHNVESDYFHLYLLTLYQKLRLSTFSGELMRRGEDLYQNIKEAGELWYKFTMFRNHYWFPEVTFKPQGTELYKRFQQGLNILSLYEGVSKEVGELQLYYDRKAEHEIAEGTRELQQEMGKNVEATRNTADRQLALTQAMKENVEATNKLQSDMTNQIKIVANIQMKIEVLEIFIVGFYFAELTHLIISYFEKDYHIAIGWAIVLTLGVGAVAGLITWWFVTSSHKEPETSNPAGP